MRFVLFADTDRTATAVEQLRHLTSEELLEAVLVQLIIILLAARIFAKLAHRCGQPGAVGEIVAGLLLGPSLLGWLLPSVSNAIFHPTFSELDSALSNQVCRLLFSTLSQVGLILLLFLIGLEFDFQHLRWHGTSALVISSAGILFPFAFGLAAAPVLLASEAIAPSTGPPLPWLGFALFLGTAMSITALPTLGRMMVELNIQHTRAAVITIAAAAVDDVCGWIILATVAAIVRSSFDPWQTCRMIAGTIVFGAVVTFAIGPLTRRWLRGMLDKQGQLRVTALALVLALVFTCAWMTSQIGIFAVFGAFLLGASLSREPELRRAITPKLSDFVAAFFLPIFFTYTGLQTNIGSLATPYLWLLCGMVLLAAVLGKWGGCGLAARACGFSWREAGCIGIMMNTRALMELVVINLGKDLGVVPDSVYCMLVLMAIATTLLTTPLLRWFAPGTELEAALRPLH